MDTPWADGSDMEPVLALETRRLKQESARETPERLEMAM
jgi:hypothetical protein